jgi:hypothetical protein
MANARLSFSAQGYDEWRRTAKALRGAPKELRANMRKQIMQAGRPVLDEVKEAARTIPVTSSRGGGARRRQYYATFRSEQAARKAGRDVEVAISRAIRRKHGLRQAVANAAKLQIRARGIRFVIDAGSLPPSQRSLPRHLDSEKGWRHPVFGNREEWVHQQGRPYFGSTISKRAAEFRRAALTAMDETFRKI